jgi:hypothetical protein
LAHSVDDYNLLMVGNESMLAERNELRYHTEDLESELVKACADSVENIATLEAKLKSAEAHGVDVAADGEKHLQDFEKEFVKDFKKLPALYVRNVQSIKGLCLPIPGSEPSAANYLHWLSAELTGLSEMFAGVNENFISAMVEGTLVMAGSSVYLGALWTVAVDNRANILPMEKDARRAARAISKKWWCSFGYDYVLAAIQAKFRVVTTHVFVTPLLSFLALLKEKK